MYCDSRQWRRFWFLWSNQHEWLQKMLGIEDDIAKMEALWITGKKKKGKADWIDEYSYEEDSIAGLGEDEEY